MSQDTFGFNPLVLRGSVGKRFVEGMSGIGRLQVLSMWMEQLDAIEGIAPLLNDISRKLMFYDMALTKCAKEALKRPEFIREEEIGNMLGYTCNQCGKPQPALGHGKERYCSCGGRFILTYLTVYKMLRALKMLPTPEAVLMAVAYDGFADAYVEAFTALRMVLQQLSEAMHWSDTSPFLDMELKDQLDSYFLYYQQGDTRLQTEDKELLQFIIRGNLSNPPIDLRIAEKLIRLGMAVCKYGHLCNQLYIPGADFEYTAKRTEFFQLYNEVNRKIRLSTPISDRERRKHTVTIEPLAENQYYACALLLEQFWQTGKLAKDLFLKPLVGGKFPVFSDEKNLAANFFVTRSGGGKTTFMAAVVYHAIEYAHEYVFNILGDEKNGLTLACLPLFHNGGSTGELLNLLADIKIEPKPIPCLNLTFLCAEGSRAGFPPLREGVETVTEDMTNANPPTKFDRIVDIDKPWSFGIKFWATGKTITETKDTVGNRGVLNILKEFALNLGYKEPCGLINVRNLLRRKYERETSNQTRPDIQIATTLLQKFATFRQYNKKQPARVLWDEMSVGAPVQHTVAGSDTAKSSATLGEAIKALRGANASFDGATQRWTEINPSVKAEAFNVFFRELPRSRDLSSSQRDLLLSSLDPLEGGKAERDFIGNLMERRVFPAGDYFWFWWNLLRGSIQVVRPNPPPFMINQPRKTNMEIFKAYKKLSGDESVLLDSWDEVPHLRYEPDEY